VFRIKDLNVQTDIPVIFCVLTDNTMQQSIDRSGGIHGNKGTEAAIAAIKMVLFQQAFDTSKRNQNLLPTGPLRIDKGF
jgi:6,7-dimethyl-8-ribityllumazine synthase